MARVDQLVFVATWTDKLVISGHLRDATLTDSNLAAKLTVTAQQLRHPNDRTMTPVNIATRKFSSIRRNSKCTGDLRTSSTVILSLLALSPLSRTESDIHFEISTRLCGERFKRYQKSFLKVPHSGPKRLLNQRLLLQNQYTNLPYFDTVEKRSPYWVAGCVNAGYLSFLLLWQFEKSFYI